MFDMTTLTITALIVLSIAFVDARRRGKQKAREVRNAALNQAHVDRKASLLRHNLNAMEDVWRHAGGSEAKHVARV